MRSVCVWEGGVGGGGGREGVPVKSLGYAGLLLCLLVLKAGVSRHRAVQRGDGAGACNTQAERSAGGLGANMIRDEGVEGLGVRRRVVLTAHLRNHSLAARRHMHGLGETPLPHHGLRLLHLAHDLSKRQMRVRRERWWVAVCGG